MGNAASRIAIDSYLDRHACSGRNLTWQYIHNRGALPTPYSNCPYAPAILKSHCCANGVCDPGYFDREFDRYKAFDWDGLGDPGPVGNGTGKVGNGKGEGVNKSLCLGMELVRSTAKTHWPPLGLDGLPMKEFSSVEWVRPLLRNGVYISHGKGEKGKRGSAWNERVEDSAVIWNPTKGSLSREFVEQSLSRGNERLAMWPIVIFSLGICALLVVLVVSYSRRRRNTTTNSELRKCDLESGTEQNLDNTEASLYTTDQKQNPSRKSSSVVQAARN